MQRWISSLAVSAVLAVAALAFAPASAEAQCSWGCACAGSACGCNSNGNGGRCDSGATGCVVSACNETRLYFAPDGSVLRFASAETTQGVANEVKEDAPLQPQSELGGTTRWEAAQDGRSVARHCSGVVLARYYAREEAAAIRQASGTLTL